MLEAISMFTELTVNIKLILRRLREQIARGPKEPFSSFIISKRLHNGNQRIEKAKIITNIIKQIIIITFNI
jgi:hypothetical protein